MSGMPMENVVSPSRESASSVHPWLETTHFTTASPSPKPVSLRLRLPR